MSKRAILLHGTSGSVADHWFPWLKDALQASGYDVLAPSLPGNNAPNKDRYDAYLRSLMWDYEGSLVVGYSSGATTALNLLMQDWFPRVRAVVLVGVFLNERLVKSADWYVNGQFDKLFPDNGFNVDVIKQKAGRIYIIHGDDDPYCSYDDAKEFAEKLGATFIVVPNGQHLGVASGLKELPVIIETMLKDEVL